MTANELRRAILAEVRAALEDIAESTSYRTERDLRIRESFKRIRAMCEQTRRRKGAPT